MKTPYKNIYDVLKLNRFIVLATVIGAVLTCIVSVLMVIKLHRESMDNAFVVNGDGSVIPLKMVSQLENLEVEAKAHLELFHRYFYGIDVSNYENNLEKALWLGNSSVEYGLAIFRQGEEAAAAHGRFTHVFVDRDSERPQAIEGELRRGLEQLLDADSHG